MGLEALGYPVSWIETPGECLVVIEYILHGGGIF